MPGYIVAENKNFAGSTPLQFFKMDSNCSRKPISQSLSASSITRNSRSSNLNFSVNYASFNGLAIRISVDDYNFLNVSKSLGKRALRRNFTLGVNLELSEVPAPLKIRNSL